VLWIEYAISRGAMPMLGKWIVWIAAVGIVLPTMHQSSLGSLMLISGPKLHPLWNTPLLPLFFLVTCLAMGYSMVAFESRLNPLMRQLQTIATWSVFFFVLARFADLAYRGEIGRILTLDLYGVMFWIETLLFLAPLAASPLRGAMLLLAAGALYRFDTFLVAFDPGPGWHYFPSVPELFITIGLVAFEIAACLYIVKTFPIGPAIKENT